jgi:6-pyruvoyltetrahydropterin/6-carboxytetrahydropterin synthase
MALLIQLSRWTTFQCAHHLPRMPEGHKCRRVHGHSYRLTLTCEDTCLRDGIVFDNAEIDWMLEAIVARLDHQNLNALDLPFANNPTAENILLWCREFIRHRGGPVHARLRRIELQEGERSTFALDLP